MLYYIRTGPQPSKFRFACDYTIIALVYNIIVTLYGFALRFFSSHRVTPTSSSFFSSFKLRALYSRTTRGEGYAARESFHFSRKNMRAVTAAGRARPNDVFFSSIFFSRVFVLMDAVDQRPPRGRVKEEKTFLNIKQNSPTPYRQQRL